MIDLRADLHGHVLDYVTGRDRQWFADHPGAVAYIRRAEPHELCIPGPEGVACWDHAGRWIRLIDFGGGLRGRLLA